MDFTTILIVGVLLFVVGVVGVWLYDNHKDTAARLKKNYEEYEARKKAAAEIRAQGHRDAFERAAAAARPKATYKQPAAVTKRTTRPSPAQTAAAVKTLQEKRVAAARPKTWADDLLETSAGFTDGTTLPEKTVDVDSLTKRLEDLKARIEDASSKIKQDSVLRRR